MVRSLSSFFLRSSREVTGAAGGGGGELTYTYRLLLDLLLDQRT